MVSGSEDKQRQCLHVFWHLYAVVETSKERGVVILIQHSDPHCGFGIIGWKASIFCINCQNKDKNAHTQECYVSREGVTHTMYSKQSS